MNSMPQTQDALAGTHDDADPSAIPPAQLGSSTPGPDWLASALRKDARSDDELLGRHSDDVEYLRTIAYEALHHLAKLGLREKQALRTRLEGGDFPLDLTRQLDIDPLTAATMAVTELIDNFELLHDHGAALITRLWSARSGEPDPSTLDEGDRVARRVGKITRFVEEHGPSLPDHARETGVGTSVDSSPEASTVEAPDAGSIGASTSERQTRRTRHASARSSSTTARIGLLRHVRNVALVARVALRGLLDREEMDYLAMMSRSLRNTRDDRDQQ